MTSEQEWEQVLQIKTTGRDDSRSDSEHHPYEPTDYCVLERLANSGYITKQNTLIDYGSGKGRVSIFMANQTRCHSIGIEYDERLYERAVINGESPAAKNRVSFVLGDAATFTGSIINVGVTPLRCHFQHYFFALNCQVKCNSTE